MLWDVRHLISADELVLASLIADVRLRVVEVPERETRAAREREHVIAAIPLHTTRSEPLDRAVHDRARLDQVRERLAHDESAVSRHVNELQERHQQARRFAATRLPTEEHLFTIVRE